MLALNSTFHPFPSSVEGISEHLMTLSQAQFSSEMQNKIEAIINHQPFRHSVDCMIDIVLSYLKGRPIRALLSLLLS